MVSIQCICRQYDLPRYSGCITVVANASVAPCEWKVPWHWFQWSQPYGGACGRVELSVLEGVTSEARDHWAQCQSQHHDHGRNDKWGIEPGDILLHHNVDAKSVVDTKRHLLLYGRWGFSSLYHWVIDALFPVFLAAKAAGIDCHAAHCDIATVNDHQWDRAFEQINEVSKMFGFHALRGDRIPRALRYASVVVGSFHKLSPTDFPLVNANEIVWLGPHAMHDWRAFRASGLIGAGLHAGVGHDAHHGASDVVWIHRPAATYAAWYGRTLRGMDDSEMRAVSHAYAAALPPHVADTLLVVDTSLMTVVEQTRIMSGAAIVGGLEGAGFVLQIWMPLGGAAFMLTSDKPLAFQWTYGQYLRALAVFLTGTNDSPRGLLFQRAANALAHIASVPRNELHTWFNDSNRIHALDQAVPPRGIGTLGVSLAAGKYMVANDAQHRRAS